MNSENDWKKLDQCRDIYKFHWHLSLQLCIFTLGISGGISAYAIKHADSTLVQYVIWLPFFLCIVGYKLSKAFLPNINSLSVEVKRLESRLGVKSFMTLDLLVSFIEASKSIFVILMAGLFIVFVFLKHYS